MVKKYFLLLALFFLLTAYGGSTELAEVLQLTAYASEEVRIIETKGMAALSEDVGRDRENALADAQRLAVEECVGVYVDSQTLVENYTAISDEVYTKAVGFIESYEILEEGKDEGEGIYFVKIRAVVSLRPVMAALKALGVLREWRIMIVIPEEHVGYTLATPACETEVIRKFIEAGYYVVDQKQISKIRKSKAVDKAAEGDIKSAKDLGRRFGAEILIAGEALSELATETMTSGEGYGELEFTFKSARAQVSARAIRIDTGEIITAQSVSASVADLSQVVAGKKALTQAGEKLATLLIDEITLIPASVTKHIQVVISEFSYEEVKSFEEKLKGLRGVKKTYLSEYTAGAGYLDVEYVGKSSGLAKELKAFGLKVTSISGNRIDVKAK